MADREPIGWFTSNGARIPIYDGQTQDEAMKEFQMKANQQIADKKNAEDKDAWRMKAEKYQKKTDGGVYFYSSDKLWGQDIDEKMYDKLPKHIKKSVVMMEARKTVDGNHCEIYYVNKDGKIEWFDEYGLRDFMAELKSTNKDEFGNVMDWQYDGQYNEGKQLKRKN